MLRLGKAVDVALAVLGAPCMKHGQGKRHTRSHKHEADTQLVQWYVLLIDIISWTIVRYSGWQERLGCGRQGGQEASQVARWPYVVAISTTVATGAAFAAALGLGWHGMPGPPIRKVA